MAELTRRSFLTHTSIGVAGGVLVGTLATEVAQPSLSQLGAAELPSGVVSTEPLVAHIKDVRSGEIALMVGTREVIYKDRELAARLAIAANKKAGR